MRYLPLFLASSLLGAAACASAPEIGAPLPPDSVTTAEALADARTAAGFGGEIIAQMNFGLPNYPALSTGPLPSALASFGIAIPLEGTPPPMRIPGDGIPLGCTWIQHGYHGFGTVPDDVNGDKIADDAAFQYECLNTDFNGTPSPTGRTEYHLQEYTVKERSGGLWGYDATLHIVDRYGGAGRDSTYDFVAEEHSFVVAEGAEHSAFVTRTTTALHDTTFIKEQAGVSWTASFAPASPIPAGGPFPDGALSYTGKVFLYIDKGRTVSFILSTPTPLVYSAACRAAMSTPPFTAGAVQGRMYNNVSGAGFSATFTGCGATPMIVTEGTRDPS